MDYQIFDAGGGAMPKEKQRQLFFLGMGLYGAIFMINVVSLFAYEMSSPHIGLMRIVTPVLTIVFIVGDTALLRSLCRKQFPTFPDLLTKWPINVPDYPTWLYYVYLLLSSAISLFLVSKL